MLLGLADIIVQMFDPLVGGKRDVGGVEASPLRCVSCCLLIFQHTWLHFMMGWNGDVCCASGLDRSELVLNSALASSRISTCCSNPSSFFRFSRRSS